MTNHDKEKSLFLEAEIMKAILAKTTTDIMKSKILSPSLSQLVFDVYITPSQFAEIIEKYDQKEFEITVSEDMV